MRALSVPALFLVLACTQPSDPSPKLAELDARVATLEAHIESVDRKLSAFEEEARARAGELTALERARLDLERSQPDEPAPPAGPTEKEMAENIKCKATTCTMARDFAESMLANPAALSRQARLVPATEGGVSVGFKVYGVRPDSLLHVLQFQNGDVLQSVNGEPLTSMDAAMEAYSKIRDADKLVFGVQRAGKTEKITVVFE